MQMARRVMHTAKNEESDDGQVLVVYSVDIHEMANPNGAWRTFAACWT
jgi:hypothetical protein